MILADVIVIVRESNGAIELTGWGFCLLMFLILAVGRR